MATKRSTPDIDISTKSTGPKTGWRGNLVIWGILLPFFLALLYFELPLWWFFAIVPVFLLAFVAWIGWILVVRRGVLTWMPLTLRPAKLMAQGDAVGAEAAYQKALARARRFAERDHRRGLMLCELAMFAKYQGRSAEALALYEESVAILEEHTGKHPLDYFIALNNYGICFIYLKRFDEAQRILQQVIDLTLAARKREANSLFMMPPQHVSMLEFLLHMNLAVLFLTMNELAEAELQLRDADKLLPMMSKKFAAIWHDHYIGICALWEFESGKFAAAESEIAEAHNPDYFVCLRVRAKLHMVRQEFAEAERLFRLYQDAERKKGTLHRPDYLLSTVEFAESLLGQGKHDDAFKTLQEARAIVADFALPADAKWRTTLESWLTRARDLGKADAIASLEAELRQMPAPVEQRITILEQFRTFPHETG